MLNFAQTYYYQPTTVHKSAFGAYIFVYLILIAVFVIANWKIFVKAGEEGWKSIIPIWNTIVMLRIVGYSPWYILIFLIPFVNFIFAIVVAYKLAQAFGYGVGMTILEFVFGIGLLIIGFGDSKYLDSEGSSKPDAQPVTPAQ